MAQSVKSALEL